MIIFIQGDPDQTDITFFLGSGVRDPSDPAKQKSYPIRLRVMIFLWCLFFKFSSNESLICFYCTFLHRHSLKEKM